MTGISHCPLHITPWENMAEVGEVKMKWSSNLFSRMECSLVERGLSELEKTGTKGQWEEEKLKKNDERLKSSHRCYLMPLPWLLGMISSLPQPNYRWGDIFQAGYSCIMGPWDVGNSVPGWLLEFKNQFYYRFWQVSWCSHWFLANSAMSRSVRM